MVPFVLSSLGERVLALLGKQSSFLQGDLHISAWENWRGLGTRLVSLMQTWPGDTVYNTGLSIQR